MTARITREGGDILIRVPVDEVQSLRIALQPCTCRNTKSTATAAIRNRFVKGLGQALFMKPKPTGETEDVG